ncbi:hypothetical protein GH714_006920 [Hevea brasiliensis]|uniref:Uncharacterized protein n=1 Tax=Hevea brasiliensis TaxID=3981 RepID=A0A6A6MCD6_HEVBR|nr:hypothetical protein GH714_006920 [Hevea brasiliensis]
MLLSQQELTGWCFGFIRLKNMRLKTWSGPPGIAPDPGTSTGMTLVGRARIPLPEVSVEKGGRYGLIRREVKDTKLRAHLIFNDRQSTGFEFVLRDENGMFIITGSDWHPGLRRPKFAKAVAYGTLCSG